MLKLPIAKLEPWLALWNFFLLRFHFFTFSLFVDLCRFIIQHCMEYCFHAWTGAPNICLDILSKLQKREDRIVAPTIASSLEPLVHCWNVVDISFFFHRYYCGKCSSGLAELASLHYSRWIILGIVISCLIFFVIIHRCYKNVYVNSFFPHTARLWNSLPAECFLTWKLENLMGEKKKI